MHVWLLSLILPRPVRKPIPSSLGPWSSSRPSFTFLWTVNEYGIGTKKLRTFQVHLLRIHSDPGWFTSKKIYCFRRRRHPVCHGETLEVSPGCAATLSGFCRSSTRTRIGSTTSGLPTSTSKENQNRRNNHISGGVSTGEDYTQLQTPAAD